MDREFFASLEAVLQTGDSVTMLTVVSGVQNGRELTAQKAFLHHQKIVVQDSSLDEFWREIAPEMPLESAPQLVEANGFHVLAERIAARQRLIICGGGHIAVSLAAIGSMLDFDVTVIDDRAEFANRERFPSVKEILCAPFDEALEQLGSSNGDYFVIVTRGHSHDRMCLEQVLRGRFAYAGMIGSRKKVAVVMKQMERDGYDRTLLERVHAPIGLRIGAQTPAEIAVCIAAEMIQERSTSSDGCIPADGLRLLAQGVPMAMATIIEKRGSAPRSTGAKMVVDENGRIYGTIGGGSAEAETVEAIPAVLSVRRPRVADFNMTNSDAQKAGMVCGGTIKVLIEPVNFEKN